MSREPLSIELPTRRATIQFAKRLAPLLKPSDLVVLSGALGAGKTFFVRALCRALGLPQTERVTSPTFALVHEHEARLSIAHADLYRLTGANEVRDLGLDALREEGRLVLVEWGENWLEVLGSDALLIALSLSPRRALVSATGERSTQILDQLAT